MVMNVQELPTSGEIARQTGTTRDAVQHIIRSRGIQPAAKAGHVFVYGPEAVERIKRELGVGVQHD